MMCRAQMGSPLGQAAGCVSLTKMLPLRGQHSHQSDASGQPRQPGLGLSIWLLVNIFPRVASDRALSMTMAGLPWTVVTPSTLTVPVTGDEENWR